VKPATNPTRTAMTEHARETARALIRDAHDQACHLALMIEEAGDCLTDGDNVLGALGTLADYDASRKALHALVTAAQTLLLRARDGSGR
jgi:hypothetical protein